MEHPSAACAACAHALLDALQAVNAYNTKPVGELAQSRANCARQLDGTSCGWHALHYVETEMRRYAGEGQYPVCFVRAQRVELLRLLINKFRE